MNPTKITGRWREGFALDYHPVSSQYIGDDEFGHPVFDTKRTELGELLLLLKYRSDLTAVAPLAEAAASFVESWKPGADLIVPVPPSRSDRPRQPVSMLAEALGKRLGVAVRPDCVSKTKVLQELKNVYDYATRLKLLQGAYSVLREVTQGRSVLLFDDLYRSGATMNVLAEAPYGMGRAKEVLALTITRTRVKK